MIELLDYGFMRNALVASLLIGACAPLVGIFLVQRRLSLIGDGIGPPPYGPRSSPPRPPPSSSS